MRASRLGSGVGRPVGVVAQLVMKRIRPIPVSGTEMGLRFIAVDLRNGIVVPVPWRGERKTDRDRVAESEPPRLTWSRVNRWDSAAGSSQRSDFSRRAHDRGCYGEGREGGLRELLGRLRSGFCGRLWVIGSGRLGAAEADVGHASIEGGAAAAGWAVGGTVAVVAEERATARDTLLLVRVARVDVARWTLPD